MRNNRSSVPWSQYIVLGVLQDDNGWLSRDAARIVAITALGAAPGSALRVASIPFR